MRTASRVPHFGNRTPPPHVVEGLRALDPDAELVYWGWGKWVLGTMTNDVRLQPLGQRLLVSTLRAINKRPWRVALQRDVYRIRMARLRLAGFRVTAEYELRGSPDSSIVNDQRCMDWMYRTMNDEAVDRALQADKEAARATALADLTDEARGRDGWKYMFTKSHSVTRFDGPVQRARSGFQIHRTLS